MRFILLLIFFIFYNTLIAQTSLSIANGQNIYTYNNTKDTIFLSKIEDRPFFCCCDTVKIIDTIQIDNFGSKEIVFYRTCHWNNDSHGGTFDNLESFKISKYEIWNLDTKEMIFEAISFYEHYYKKSHSYYGKENGFEFYSYDYKIDSVGTITIGQLITSPLAFKAIMGRENNKTENIKITPNDYVLPPNKIEGTYRYVNGKYIHE